MLDIVVILDRSGSMEDARSDHEGGLRSFVTDQRDLEDEARFTLIQFDHVNPCEILFDRVPIEDVDTSKIVLIPRGGTPLLDAVGRAVAHVRAQVPDDGNVVVMVITDGHENSSREWTKDRVKALVTELEQKNWSFLFLGANVDAFAEAGKMGIPMAAAMGYANVGGAGTVNAMYAATSDNLGGTRSSLRSGQPMRVASASLSYTIGQRQAAMHKTKTDDDTVDLSVTNSTAVSGGVNGPISSSGDLAADQKTEG